MIYAPAGEAHEYAPLAANPYSGCGHGCVYCYVPRQLHMTREQFDAGAHDRERFIAGLPKEAPKYQRAGITEQVLISFTSDPYHPFDTELTRWTLEVLREHGLAFTILSKGGVRALRDIDLYRPKRDAYAVTLTSLDDKFSLRFEPNAPLPGDRIAAMKAFHERGIFVWCSLEPTLDIEHSLAVVRATAGFCDLYKVGKANNLGAITKTTDWRGYTLQMIDLLHQLNKRHYIKKSLQEHLPNGYRNPMRVPQHH
jgi:DNA repair photolyase